MNFPLFHWNIARIPVEIMIFATTFLFWWRATLVKFGWEVMPQHFLFEWKSVSEKFGREVTPPHFHFQSKSTSHAEVVPLHFYFQTDFQFPCYRRGQRSGHMHSPCAFLPHIRQPTQACMQAKHENSQLPTYTALAPFSPSLMRCDDDSSLPSKLGKLPFHLFFFFFSFLFFLPLSFLIFIPPLWFSLVIIYF